LLLGGVSVKGSYHQINQDFFIAQKIENGFVVALSDGLGSKKTSQIGSKAICESVVEEAEELKQDLADISPSEFIFNVHSRWLEKLEHHKINECYATILALVFYSGRLLALRLGDGFIGFWTNDGVYVLFDRKEDYFVNETDCLTELYSIDKFEFAEFEVSELNGGVMCSDGIPIGEMNEKDLKSFTKDFIEGYNTMSLDEINKDIESWVTDWQSIDDKTLAYFISEVHNNGTAI
jgi:serine/threonine protein phosphatase PrpC